MLIAIPSVTSYINNSRKQTYVNSIKEMIKGATALVNSGELDIFDEGVTYYIPTKAIPLESGGKSPYGGDIEPAYIAVTYDGEEYDYYFMGKDEEGMGIKIPASIDRLSSELIESELTDDDIKPTIGIDKRNKVIVFDEETLSPLDMGQPALSIVGVTGEIVQVIYPDGKDKSTVTVGDIVKIGTEEFYVINRDKDDLILLARYNLNVGYNKVEGTEGIQNKMSVGYILGTQITTGTISFSSSVYWTGVRWEDFSNTNDYPYVADENCIIYPYLTSYKNYLEKTGITIKETRLLKYNEAVELGCNGMTYHCTDAPYFLNETSFWLGSASINSYIWAIHANTLFGYGYMNRDNSSTNGSSFGIRPVVVI